MKYILEKDNLEIVGKQYLKDVGGYDGTNADSCKDIATVCKDIATVFPNMVEITYSELKKLKYSSNLIPGQQYRITDYVTTTIQENTKSAGHRFDIIVTADAVNVLNENARACKHEGDIYFETENLESWELKYCLDNDTDRFAWANDSHIGEEEFVAIYWDDPVDGENYDSKIGEDKIYDWGIEYDSELDKDNIVIYKSDESLYIEEGSADYEDKYFYRGIVNVDDVEYDSWKKWDSEIEDWCYDEDRGQQYALTKRIVFVDKVIWSNESIIGNDSSNCVIKDEFDAGPDDSGYYALSEYIYPQSIMMNDPENGDSYESLDKDMFSHYGYETEPNGNNSLFLLGCWLDFDEETGEISNDGFCEDNRYYYRGIITVDGEEYDCWQKWETEEGYILDDENSYYYLTNRIVDGIVKSGVEHGKGVIYRMIDEYGNDLPYDFKNIMFKRWLYADGGGITDEENGDFESYCYTFSWEESNGDIIDASIFGNNGHLLNDEGQISGVYGNIMCVRMDYGDYVENHKSTKQWLNNNVFFSTYGYDFFYYGCGYNIFGNDCHSNTLGNYSHSNTFGDYCHSNTFGDDCNYNTFGNSCSYNTFGDYCTYNTFGNSCSYNTFGNKCNSNIFSNSFHYNTFGDDCNYNTFGNSCSYNTFGDYCYSNTFGNSCSYNTFGDYCTYNTFGNSCSYNTFGDYCTYNTFGDFCNYNTFGSSKSSPSSYYRYIIFDNGNSYINLYCTSTTSILFYYQNVRIGLGVNNTTTYKTISDSNIIQTFETLYIKEDSQTIKI